MKYLKLYEELKSYEKEFEFKNGYYWLISDIKTLMNFALMLENEKDRKIIMFHLEHLYNDSKIIIGFIIYRDIIIRLYDLHDEKSKQECSEYLEERELKYGGEIKIIDRCKIIVDTLEVDVKKYNL